MPQTSTENQQQPENKIVLKVSGDSNPMKVATSIVKNMQEGKQVETLTIGAGALNQATKAIVIARGMIAAQGFDVLIRPGFADLIANGDTKTAIRQVLVRF